MSILQDAGVAFPEYEARYIITHLLECTNTEYLHLRGEAFPPELTERANVILTDRMTGRPLQYILGETEFYGLKLRVSEGCLIPRNDTENLVKYIIDNAPQNAVMADICTGSGCIAVAVLANRPDMSAAAIDISPEALTFAERNAALHGVTQRITLICADALTCEDGFGTYDVLASNPPYLTSRDMSSLDPEVEREPAKALFGGFDGLNFYRKLTAKWLERLNKDGFLIYEVGIGQCEAVEEILSEEQGSIEFLKDLGGIARNVIFRK